MSESHASPPPKGPPQKTRNPVERLIVWGFIAALLVVVYSIVIQVAENNILVPRLMGRSVGVSPVVVILAVFTFSSLLGITGAFLAIPLAAILQVLMDHLVVHAGVLAEEPGADPPGVMAGMRAQIRRLRAEAMERLRTGHGRISLSTGELDDVDIRVDHLLSKADDALTQAAQRAGTDTAETHTALLAEVDQVINQAGEMVEEANVEAAADTAAADQRGDQKGGPRNHPPPP